MKSIHSLFQRCFKIIVSVFIVSLISYTSYCQDLSKSIPSSSSGVLTMDGENFLSKLDIPQILRLEMFQEMDEYTQGKKGKRYNEYSKIYKAPESIGLKINAKWHLFTHHPGDTSNYGHPITYTVITLPLLSSKKFEKFIKKVTDSTIVKSSGYKYVITGFSQLVIWNKHQLYFVMNSYWGDDNKEKLVKEFNYLTRLKPEESIKSNANFNLAQSSKFDFNYWMSYHSLLSGLGVFRYAYLEPGLDKLPGSSPDFYDGSYLHLYLNFNKGNVSFEAKQYMKPESAKQLEFIYGKGINPELLKYIHKDHMLGMAGFSSNLKGIKSFLDTALHDTIKTNITESLIKEIYQSRFNSLPEIKKLNIQIDSMYNDLYASEYDNIKGTDTTEVYNAYEDEYTGNYDDYSDTYYDTTVVDSVAVPATESSEEEYPAAEYEETSEYQSDTTVIEFDPYAIPADSSTTVPAYNAYDVRDSIYEAKNKKIVELNDKKDKLREEYYKKKIKEYDLKPLEFLDYFEGDFLIACTGYKFLPRKYKTYEYDEEEYTSIEVERTRNEPVPDIVAIMTLKDVNKVQSFIKKQVKDTFLIKEGNHYYFSEIEKVKVYLAISGNLLIITNDSLLVTNNLSGFSAKEEISEEIKSIMLNKQASAFVSLKDIFARIPFDNLSPSKHEQYTLLMNSFVNTFSTGESFNNSISNAQLQLNLTNKIDNSFYEILRITNEFYKISRKR